MDEEFILAVIRGYFRPQVSNNILSNRFAIVDACLFLYFIILNHSVSGSIVVNNFIMSVSLLLPL